MSSKNKRLLFSAYWIWVFMHLGFLLFGISNREGSLFLMNDIYGYSSSSDYFFPFVGLGLMVYDLTEFFVYVGAPLFAYYLYRYNKQ